MVKPKGLWFSQPATRSGTFPKEASQRIWMVIPIQKAGIQKSCWRGFLLPLGLEDQEDVQVEWIKNNKNTLPIGSMYAIYGCIYHQYTPNVSIYTIHGSSGLYLLHIDTVTKAFADICSLDELASSRMSSHFVRIRIFHVFSKEPDTCQNAFSPQELVINTELCTSAVEGHHGTDACSDGLRWWLCRQHVWTDPSELCHRQGFLKTNESVNMYVYIYIIYTDIYRCIQNIHETMTFQAVVACPSQNS